MMSLAKAEADLARLTNQIAEWKTQIAEAEIRAAKISAYLEMARIYESDDSSISDHHTPLRGGRPPGGVSHEAVRLAIEAITLAQGPIHTRPLIDILHKRGVEIGGQNPVANLSGFLSRSEKLKNSRSHGWSLAEWPNDYPPGSDGEAIQSGAFESGNDVTLDAGTF